MKYKVIYHTFYKSVIFADEIYKSRQKQYIVKSISLKEVIKDFSKRCNEKNTVIDYVVNMATKEIHELYELLN